ncbi:MATH domain and coiled-coil domain-containing protein At3g58410-like [Brassica napus]|uniref:MATH domain and coiled-coil domain-containing protein At3g58410-like n=1 Tax=Brassica napus TaxID=3708 RepID=UPI002078EED2|nr:MATH domain and coiled-coil domain-containing protein At3g58410-like [Brassica napus]
MGTQVGKKFAWVIKNFSSLECKICYSAPVLIGDRKWEGFLEDGDLIVVAEVDVLEVVGTSDEPGESKDGSSNLKIINGDDGVPESNDYLKIKVASFGTGNMDINGFQVLPSQVESVSRIFERHPYIAVRFRAMNQHTRETCMNILLRLIEMLCQSLDELSSNDILGADTALAYLKSVHFNVAWLEKKLDLVKANKGKEQSSLVRLQEMEDNLLELKQKCSDLDALVEKEEAELSAIRTPLSFDDVV